MGRLHDCAAWSGNKLGGDGNRYIASRSWHLRTYARTGRSFRHDRVLDNPRRADLRCRARGALRSYRDLGFFLTADFFFPTFISEWGLGGMAIMRLITASRRAAASFSLN